VHPAQSPHCKRGALAAVRGNPPWRIVRLSRETAQYTPRPNKLKKSKKFANKKIFWKKCFFNRRRTNVQDFRLPRMYIPFILSLSLSHVLPCGMLARPSRLTVTGAPAARLSRSRRPVALSDATVWSRLLPLCGGLVGLTSFGCVCESH
jgi:hypothetical protein